VVWADIWDNMSRGNLTQMTLFNRRYGRLSDWHGNWGEDHIRYEQRRSRAA
jgi:hypothetical protein